MRRVQRKKGDINMLMQMQMPNCQLTLTEFIFDFLVLSYRFHGTLFLCTIMFVLAYFNNQYITSRYNTQVSWPHIRHKKYPLLPFCSWSTFIYFSHLYSISVLFRNIFTTHTSARVAIVALCKLTNEDI